LQLGKQTPIYQQEGDRLRDRLLAKWKVETAPVACLAGFGSDCALFLSMLAPTASRGAKSAHPDAAVFGR
jgi:hypothetical protein